MNFLVICHYKLIDVLLRNKNIFINQMDIDNDDLSIWRLDFWTFWFYKYKSVVSRTVFWGGSRIDENKKVKAEVDSVNLIVTYPSSCTKFNKGVRYIDVAIVYYTHLASLPQ